MKTDIEKVAHLFSTNFTVFTFWIVVIGYFLSSATGKLNENVLLKWSSVILLYIIAYLFFLKLIDEPRGIEKRLRYTRWILQTNLVFLGSSILLLTNTDYISTLPGTVQMLLGYLTALLLIGIALAIPLALILVFKITK